MNDFLKAPKTKALLYTLCGILVILVVFGLGIVVGYRRAIFAARWSENYYPNFYGIASGTIPPVGGPVIGDPMGMMFGTFNTHGVAGEVIDVGSSSIAVEDQGGDERSVLIASGTPIREMDSMIPLIELKIGDHVTVLGEPNDDGQVEAHFIRVFEVSSGTAP